MTDEELALFNDFLGMEIGLTFPNHKREILESRLRPRLRALRLQSYGEYLLSLQYENGQKLERRELARAVTNNETYFFRETHQFDALLIELLDDLKASALHHRSLRFISAGCSSGEEAYTLNMHVKENTFRAFGWAIEIEAFDIDDTRVAIATEAEYGATSIRGSSPEKIDRYFHRTDGGVRVKPMYRSGVRFAVGNVLDPNAYGAPARADAIFCRNVLIYFSEAAMRRAVACFARSLRPEGMLFLGHSESIIGVSPAFEPVRVGSSIAYRRTGRPA
jgi:chemotaxis protein methyltransferase CheR